MIALSVGHHKDSQGAEYGGITEYALATCWVEALQTSIEDSIVVTGTLKNKVRKINNSNCVLAIEIHFNSFKVHEDANRDGVITDDELKNAGRGSETLYYPGSKNGKLLADCVQKRLGVIATPDRGAKEGWYRMDPNKGPDFFLARTKCPAIIIEPEFIHRLDIIREIKPEAIELICEGIKEAHKILYKEKL